MPLASVIYLEAANLLNDASQTIYTDAVMLPFLKSAWNKLQLQLQENGVPVMKEITAVIDVTATSEEVTLPSDFVQPITLAERADGSSEDFVDVAEVDSMPEFDPVESIIYWNWREEKVYINPPTTAREVKINYWKGLTAISGGSTSLAVNNSTEYLAYKTAALCARYIGENPERANMLDTEAILAMNILLNLEVKRQQRSPIRPRSYGSSAKTVVSYRVE
jgi:hypothetical protein